MEGLITARDFGGTAKWRTCYTSDGTGHTLLFTMDNQVVRMGVTVQELDGRKVRELLVEQGIGPYAGPA